MGKVINPATGKPFYSAQPTNTVVQLREQIIRSLRGKYDAAQTTGQNTNHWRWADNLSPQAANSLSVRKPLRERSRYETANNGYLLGIGLTLCNDMVMSGPTLQVTDRRFNDEQRTIIEAKWKKYGKIIKLRRKVWQSRFAKFQSGEGMLFKIVDNKLKFPIKYDYRIFECDQVSEQSGQRRYDGRGNEMPQIDGIRYSRQTGKPIAYHLLNEHPGETEVWNKSFGDGQWLPADQVMHWFRQDRPWLRGIPETTSTLPLWALLRRYTLAVVQNAEIAADFTVLLKSIQQANPIPFPQGDGGSYPTGGIGGDPENWFSSFPIDRGLMTVLPDMYDLTQLDPKQPVTMYDDFVAALVQEASRPLLIPRNMSLGYSGGYNMASGILDKQMYKGAITNERLDCEEVILEPCFATFWYDAVRLPGFFDEDVVTTSPIMETVNMFHSLYDETPEHAFRWDELPEHIDPVKVASAIDILHRGRHISDTDIQESRFNRSVDDHYRNLEKQDTWRKANLSADEEREAAAAVSSGSGDGDREYDE